MLRWLSRCLFWLRRLNINAGGWRPRFLVRPFIQVPAVRLAEVLTRCFPDLHIPAACQDGAGAIGSQGGNGCFIVCPVGGKEGCFPGMLVLR